MRARKVAQATRHLSRDAAAQVDVAVAGLIVALPWNRFETVLAAKIIEADPAAAEQRTRLWEAERFVRTGRTGEGGLKLLVACAEAGDVIWFMAAVDRIAEILRLEGSADTVEVRRAQAIGILAQPARALELLFAHQGDQVRTDDSDVEPGSVEEDEPTDSHQSLIVVEPPVDPRRARPTVVLHIHLSEEALLAHLAGSSCGAGGARIEQVGPVTLGQVQRFLKRAECDIQVLPVVDPAIPYRPPARGGPPGQTALDNLGPLSRVEHRLKTHGGWRREAGRHPEAAGTPVRSWTSDQRSGGAQPRPRSAGGVLRDCRGGHGSIALVLALYVAFNTDKLARSDEVILWVMTG